MIFIDANVGIANDVKQNTTQDERPDNGRCIAVKAAIVHHIGQQVNTPGNGKECSGSRYERNPAVQVNDLYVTVPKRHRLVAVHNLVGHQHTECAVGYVIQLFAVFFAPRFKVQFITDEEPVPSETTQRMIDIEG